jgi:hypothetical protein
MKTGLWQYLKSFFRRKKVIVTKNKNVYPRNVIKEEYEKTKNLEKSAWWVGECEHPE